MPAPAYAATGTRGTLRRGALFLCTALAALLVASADAPAHTSPSGSQTVSTTGAKATCRVLSHTQFAMKVRCLLDDTANDDNSIYLKHQMHLFPEKRINYKGGTETTKRFSAFSDSSPLSWRFRICRDKFGFDNCSGWKRFRT